jgi:Flp pilus assembly protein TadB
MMRMMQQQAKSKYMKRQQYICQIYNARRSFLYCLLIWMSFMVIIFLISLWLNILVFVPIAFAGSLILPFIFQKKIKRYFTRDAFLEFDDSSFSITLKKVNKEATIKVLKYNWDDIKAYKFYFTPSKLTYLDIYFKKSRWKEFGFKDDKTEEESMNSESVFSVFRSFVKRYNSTNELNGKIILKPGFLTTNVAGLFIIIVVGFIILASILVIFKNPKSFPFLLMGIFIFIPLLVKRSQDKKNYEKVSKLDQ